MKWLEKEVKKKKKQKRKNYIDMFSLNIEVSIDQIVHEMI